MSHTPGPWRTDGHSVTYPNDGIIFLTPSVREGGVMNWVDNRELIAAAPELLVAAEAVMASMWSRSKEARSARNNLEAAIKKARGEV